MILYHSGCGNSRHVAESLRQEGERMFLIPDLLRSECFELTLEPGERLGFVFPVYAWAPPRLVSDFVRQMRLKVNPDYVFMVVTCGDDCGRTRQVFARQLNAKGLSLHAAESVQMPNTYVCLPGMDVDSEPQARQKLARAESQLAVIRQRLEQRDRWHAVREGVLPRLKTYVIMPGFYRSKVTDRHYHATESCTSCGLCVRSCPLQNIELRDGRPQWLGNCAACLACYHHCPHHAIHFGHSTLRKGQYVHP